MATFTKSKLSASTNGKAVLVAATASAGTTIHTAVAGTSAWDEVWIYAQNNHTAAVDLTIEWGAAGSVGDNIISSIPSKSGLYLVAPGLLLQNGLVIKAFAGTTNVVALTGFVNQIT